ncbi:LEPR-XLL domain-containing protein [Puniceicoccales bacterium CK1056]|uniref:LEPR-XLL domain-containing protein n=1 Tax=Oceanipulchritudo coccoides TaxID=2706888 RepID=A0A6B2LZW3_9BACT|nr:calcium-binding protein [Oceanipulchritudo coccoides]NDV61616.1 LEPR-XLL domain-containing protein [Oceanipulchritudo coccoides]
MSSSSKVRGRLDLEAMEPRLLLSGDSLGVLLTLETETFEEPPDAIIVQFENEISAETDGQNGTDIFSDIEDEAILNAAPSGSQVVETDSRNCDVFELEDLKGTVSTTHFSAPVSAVMIHGNGSGNDAVMTEQIVTTLHAANGPPAGEAVANQLVEDIAANKIQSATFLANDGAWENVINEARQNWALFVYSEELLGRLDAISVSVADLPGGILGEARGLDITLDIDAAGRGWYVDPTPGDHSEFVLQSDGSYIGGNGVDLLTVVMHEMGHVLGLEDGGYNGSADLMDGVVSEGIRLLPDSGFELSSSLQPVELGYAVADAIVAGLSTSTEEGLTAITAALQDLFESNSAFGNVVPGVLETQGTGEDVVESAPTVLQILDMPTDIAENFSPSANPGFYYSGPDTLQDRYEWIKSLELQIFYPPDIAKDEGALYAMDLDGDDKVTWEEAFNVLVVGQIISYLNTATILEFDGDPGIDDDDVTLNLNYFFNGGIAVLIPGFELPDFLTDRFNLSISSSIESIGTDMKFDLDLTLSFKHDNTLYLGYESEQLGIVTDPTLPGSTASPTLLDVDAGVHFKGLMIGFLNVGGSVSASDFVFAVQDKPSDPNDGMVVSVEMDQSGTIDADGSPLARTFNINVGFLGASVTNGEIKLDMDQEGGASDPSNPDALGFTLDQQGVPYSSGVILADAVPEPVDYVLPNEIIFTLTVGTNTYSPTTEVTVPFPDTNSPAPNTSIADLVGDVDAALPGSLSSLIGVGHTGGKIQLSLPNVTTYKIGFANEASGSNSITGTSAASVIGSTNPGVVRFLLSLDGSLPKLISFTPTVVDHDADANTPDEVTVFTLGLGLNISLVLEGLGSVTASIDGAGKVTFTAGAGHTLEITHTLTIDTVSEITLAELASGQLFDVDPVAPGEFLLNLSVVTLPGLEKPDSTVWEPVGTIDFTLDPWDSNVIDAVIVDVNPVTGDNVLRSRYALKDTGGNLLADPNSGSDMHELLDFNVITTTEILGLINQLGNWFGRLNASELFNEFDILFADLALGKLLDFPDLITDTLLIDDADDGVKAATNDINRLLNWVKINDQDQLSPLFLTAQQLEVELAGILYDIDDELSLGRFADLNAAKDYVDATYDPINDRLTYELILDHELIPQEVDLDFDMDLGDLGSWDSDTLTQTGIEVEGKVKLLATGQLGFTVGLKMGNAVEALIDSANLADLNAGAGITINDHLALTTLDVITPVYGRLSADAEFKLTVIRSTPSVSVHTIEILKSVTDNNDSLDDLKGDLNWELIGTGITAEIEAGYIVLKATDPTIIQFQIQSNSGNTAFTEFGLQPEAAATVNLIAPAPIDRDLEVANIIFDGVDPGWDLPFILTIYRPGGPDVFNLNVTTAMTTGNSTYNDLVTDFNTVISAALELEYGLNGASDVVVSQALGYLVFSATHEDIVALKVTPNGVVANENRSLRATGLDFYTLQRNLEEIGVASDVDPTSLVASVVYRGPTIPTDDAASGSTFGRLSQDANFTINGVAISIDEDATNKTNSSIDDLVFDFNQAINATSLKGKVIVENIAGYIQLRSIDTGINSLTIAGLNSTEARELGLEETTKSLELSLTANKLAPISYGVTSDATFELVVTGGANAGTFTVTIDDNNTIRNRTIYDLAGTINSAINAAYIDYNEANTTELVNPLAVIVQAGKIVIGPKIGDGSGAALYNPYDGLKNNPATSAAGITAFSIEPTSTSAADQLKLASGVNVVNNANLADLLIYTRDGSMYSVSLDSLRDPAPNSVPKLVGTLGALKTLISTETSGKVELAVANDGVSLLLIDKSLPGDTDFTDDPGVLRVAIFNGSPAAIQLGIFGSDTSPLNSGSYIFNPNFGNPDGIIEGARVATVDPVDRFFIRDVIASASLTVSTVDEDDSGTTPDATAEANFGFVGVKLETTSQNQELFTANVTVPFIKTEMTLGQLYDGLVDTETVLTFIGYPTLKTHENPDPPASFTLKASIFPSLPSGLLTLGASPELQFTINNPGYLHPDLGDPSNVVEFELPDISVTGVDIGDLADFTALEFDGVLAALKQISAFLDTFADYTFLGEEIPLIGVSVNDLLEVAEKFGDAVEAVELNPAGGLQLLDQKIREAFTLPEFANPSALNDYFANLGIPDPTDLITFALENLTGGDFLRFDLRLPIGFSEGRSIDLDLGEALGVDLGPVDIQGGAGFNLTGYLDARLSFGIDLNDPTKIHLFTNASGVFGKLSAKASNLAFNAALGPLGVFIKDGNIDVSITFELDNGAFAAGSDVHTEISSASDLAGLFLGDDVDDFSPSLTGSIAATLPVYVPTDSDFLGDIKLDLTGTNAISIAQLSPDYGLVIPNFSDPGILTIPDFSGIDLSSINPFNSIPLMLDSLDFFLLGLQDIVDGEVFGFELPLIGDQLSSAAGFIDDLRKDVIKPIRQFVEQAPELGQELIQKLIFSLLGPGSDDVTFGGDSLHGFLGLSSPIPGLDLLVNYLTGADLPGTITQAVIDSAVVASNPAENDFRWLFRLRDEFTPPVDFDFDLGWDALGLDMDVGLDVTMSWDLALGLGISLTDGAYLYVGDHGRTDGDADTEELVLNLEVELEDGSDLDGRLAFLQLIAEESTVPDPDLEGENTYFEATFKVDLIEKNPTDVNDGNILTFSELGSLDAVVSMDAEAEVNLFLRLQFNEDLLPEAVTALLPAVEARFVLDWETGDIFADNFSLGGSLKLLAFKEVTFDLGSFLNDFLGPVLGKIQEITGPLQPIIDVVTFPIPVISQLAGQPVTLVDIAGLTGYVEPAMIYAIADIIELINKIDASSDSLTVTLGDFALIDTAGGVGDASLAESLSLPTFDLSNDTVFDLNGALTDSGLGSFIDNIGAFKDLLSGETGSTADLTKDLISDSEAGSSGFKFPIYENPASIFGLLLGRNVDLVTYDLAPFGMDFTYTQKFPIWDGLFARITGSAGLTIDLAFGYDTQGVREFADGGFSNPLDLLAGFFVSDTNLGPTDVPELVLRGELFAGAELNLGIASAGAEGGIILTVNFDLFDPDRDGKVRVDELLGNFLYEFQYGNPLLAPVAIFDVFGDVVAQLRLFVESAFFKFTFNITPPITLFEFSIPFEREPFLATERGDGTVLLNIGPNSIQRLNGDTRDIAEKIYVRSLDSNTIEVWGEDLGVKESAAQKYDLGENKIIVGYGGEGNDLIDLSGVTHDGISYIIEGGAGDDTLIGAQAGGIIRGDEGNDTLTGGDGTDLIIGGEGSDTIHGGGSRDYIFGDTGRLSVSDQGTDTPLDDIALRIRALSGERDGVDTIFGDGGDDIIFGGGNIDTINGDAGDDLIFGDGGYFEFVSGDIPMNGGFIDLDELSFRGPGAKDIIYGNADKDTILAGAGDDFVDGGAQNDVILGGYGFDTLYGGTGADYIYGNENDDIIFGLRDPYPPSAFTPDAADNVDDDLGDYVEGGDGNDYIRGQANDDTLHGNRGADIIFGGTEEDTIGAGVLMEPWNPSPVYPVYDNEAGGDIIFGGADDDTIDAGEGSDIVFGDDGLVAYLDFDDTTGLLPVGQTGSRIRTDSGGTHKLIGDDDASLIGTYGTIDDTDTLSLDLIVTAPVATDGSDYIVGGNGKDIIFGGGSDAGVLPTGPQRDTIFGDFDPSVELIGPRPSGQDLIIGDGGRIELFGRRYAKAKAISDSNDGVDYISGNDNGDYIFGGGDEDRIYGFEDPVSFSNSLLEGVSDNDVILGDNGEIHYNANELENRIKKIYTTYTAGDSGRSDYILGNEGNDVILGGLNSSEDILNGNLGSDVIIGDQGELIFDADADLDTLDSISSYDNNLGGSDIISGHQGDDVLIGGTAGDTMYGDDATASNGADDGEDIMLGDNGDIFLIGLTGRLLVQVAAMPAGTAVDLIETKDSAESTGGPDIMSGNAKADIMLGGVNNAGVDTMFGDIDSTTPATIADDGNDILLGDNGLLDFTYLTDTDRNTLDLIQSAEDTFGGTDIISGNKGLDVAIGGTGGDTIYGDDATASAADADLEDLLIGDNADIFLVAVNGATGPDLKVVLDTAVKTITTTDTIDWSNTGGVDTISGNAKGDIIAGGVFGDLIYGDREVPNPTTTGDDGDDLILGDNGSFEWLSTGRLSEVLGIDVFANNYDLYNWFDVGTDTDLGTLDLVTTEQPTFGGRDMIYGDEGNDVVFGGTDTDIIYGDDGDEVGTTTNNDVLFGDHGRLYPQFARFELPNSTVLVPADYPSRNFFAIDTGDTHGGAGDVMHGEEGDDLMVGQQGDDRMWGGSEDDDMIGGHNVAEGYDELGTPVIDALLNPPDNLAMNDLMDGGTGNDAMAGDNAIIWRRGDDITPRFREVMGDVIYTTGPDQVDTIITNVGSVYQSDPDDAAGRDVQLLNHSDAVQANPLGRYGADVMAGGADSDVMYGQLGDDLMQGDGSIESVAVGNPYISHQLDVSDSGNNPDTDETLYFNIPEAVTDGNDYMEGNGGNDLMYGGLGQDDIIGGSSALFGLDAANALILGVEEEALRPDGSDIIFGGAGIDIARNDIGDATEDGVTHVITTDPTGHSRDADYIMGDNANVYRLVDAAEDAFLVFNYDLTTEFENRGTSADKIIPRAMEQLDYTLGGADYAGGTYTPDGVADILNGLVDNGLPDVIHGESGDDIIFGMTGSDVLYGEGQDDDIVGGYGNDWISGGTGQDGVLGDDGLILTSRNSTIGEPLYGIDGLLASDTTRKYSNGDALDETISTPGDIQIAIINVTGALKKTIDLVPFSYDPLWIGMDDEFPDNDTNIPFADDIIFGGLGSDFLHGASGDDAISGAEALPHAYVPVFNLLGEAVGILDLGYDAFTITNPINPGDVPDLTLNPGDVLAFNPIDLDGQHLNNRFRAGEFFLYDEYDPLRKILLDSDGNLWKSDLQGVAYEFLLNFDESEGVVREAGLVPKPTGQQTEDYPQVNDDGKDALFGDNGNDWLVGGTGRDNSYGGWGNDLLNADDDHDGHDDSSDLNNTPDTHPTYEDRAYGGAGRDVLIANTGGDRLIDWVGEYNSYLVPYAPFGMASVSRTMQPFLPEFLYALSSGDGADPTRYEDAISTNVPEPTRNNPNPSRNGEPFGELGLVLQKDYAWQAQTGAPADPQAGNIPGGPRDVLRTSSFNDGYSDGFFADSGLWAVEAGAFSVAPAVPGGDALSVYYVDQYIPQYFEMMATLNPEKPTGGIKSNAYIIFDYQTETDFKFAGINVSSNKLEIGHRTDDAWVVDVQSPVSGSLKSGINYNIFLAINGSNVTLVVDNTYTLTHTFELRVDEQGYTYGLSKGMVGLGANNSVATIDNVVVQKLAPEVTFTESSDFVSPTRMGFDVQTAGWACSDGWYTGSADGGLPAVNLITSAVSPAALIILSTTLNTTGEGGFVFDYYGPDDYKFVTLSQATNEILIGHQTSKGLVTDAAFSDSSLGSGDHDLQMTLKGSTLSVVWNGQLVLSHAFNAIVTDGAFGILSNSGATSFDQVTFQTDDPAYSSDGYPDVYFVKDQSSYYWEDYDYVDDDWIEPTP